VAGQPRARGQADSDDIDSGPDLHASHDKQAKEVFETAASLFIDEESGTSTAGTPHPHPHNGYYAGDFSQTSWSGSERRPSPVTVIPAA
jgi:hypothetical protein